MIVKPASENKGMYYQGKKCQKIIFNFSPDIPISNLLAALDSIGLPELNSHAQNVKYALLELINNSLRAHREHEVTEPVTVTFNWENAVLYIEVKDKGQGFDPEELPYDFNGDPGQVDVHSARFQNYQQKNHYKRFGVGLLLAKKIFPGFQLQFYDHDGKLAIWQTGKISGTVIKMEIGATRHGT